MSTISQWCRYCGVENRPDAKSCYLCGRPLVALNQRQEIPQQQQQNGASQQSGSRTSWHSPRSLLIMLVVCIGLVVGTVATLVYLHISNPPSNITIVWQSAPSSFTQQDQQAIEKALQDSIAAQAKDVPRPSEIDIITTEREGDWAIFSTQQKTSSTEVLATEPGFFIAHNQGSSWSLLLPGTPNFCDQLKQIPDTLLAPIDKRYFCQF